MKSNRWSWVSLAVGLIVGLLVGADVLERTADAQSNPSGVNPQPAQRFQISAWAYAARDTVQGRPSGADNAGERGCYMVDTVTGDLWHAAADGKPKKIGEKLK